MNSADIGDYYVPKTIEKRPSISSEDSQLNHGSDTISVYGAINESIPLINSEYINIGGISVLTAAIFVAGEMAGSGILALPKAVVDSGWIGLVLIVVFGINSGYSGARLGDCWAIVEERYPEYRNKHTRDPYSVIAEKALGPWARVLVSACIQITLLGAGTVYLLLASDMVKPYYSFVSFIGVACALLLPMWLESPKDFWWAGSGALLSTMAACVFIFTQILMDGIQLGGKFPQHKVHSWNDFFTSFGILLFAFGGASTFPTIQNDMIRRREFPRSIIIAFAVILLLYLPISAGGYLVYGELLGDNIILSLGQTELSKCATVCMAIHLILAFLIVINPVSQQLEEKFNVPNEFCVKRCAVRTCMSVVMIIIGTTVPSFYKILSLIGGSTVTLSTFVLPSLCYMKLCDQQSPDWERRFIPVHKRVYMYELMGIGLLGGICTTYSAMLAILK